MLKPRPCPLGVALHAGGVGDLQLLGEVLDHHVRHIQRVSKEGAHVAGRGQDQAEAEPVVIAPPLGDQRLVGSSRKKNRSSSARDGRPV